MKNLIPNLFCTSFFLACGILSAYGQNKSVLSTGDWYKISTDQQGVYKIDYSQLKTMGVDIDNIDPRHIQLYGNGGKLLPQKNSAVRPKGLIQNAIHIEGEGDGDFSNQDYILFYVPSIDSTYFDITSGNLMYTNHYYEEKSYYYITIGNNAGLRIINEPNQGNDFDKATTYNYYEIYEEDKVNLLISGREWYGDRYSANTTTFYSYPFKVKDLATSGTLKITSSVMAQSYATSDFEVSLNGTILGNQEIAGVTTYQYGLKGRENVKSFNILADQISDNDNNFDVEIKYNVNDSDRSIGFTNYVIFQADRLLQYNSEQFDFRSLQSLENPFTTFEVSSSNSELRVWDISTPFLTKNQEATFSNNTLSFGTHTMDLKEFVVFEDGDSFTAEFMGKIKNQNLRGAASPEILIVAHPDFRYEASRLADFRKQHDGFDVLVVTPQEVYNEFSSGSQDPTAIRDLAKHYYDQGTLKHVLLFGKCSYDFKDIKSNNKNFVPTYPSRNSLHPLKTYSSDDYFGFLEDDEGDWVEQSSGDHTLDIGVGRLPVASAEEAQNVVDKIIGYANTKTNLGNWRNNVYYVADDGEITGSLHHKQADQLTVFIDTTYSSFNTKKIFLDSYKQVSKPSGVEAPEVNTAINKALEDGALIVNYTGHGSMREWAQESILTLSMIGSWTNSSRLPLFVTATCEFGRHDDPTRVSGAERTVLNPNGGSIAIVTTGRPVNSGSNFLLNKAFYNNVFMKINGRYPTLGEVFLATKNESLNGASNRNFSLLGDPSMTLAYPSKEVIIDKVQNNDGQIDTLKALSTVTIEGYINNSPDFEGTAQITVFDKQIPLQTIGNENPVYQYKEWENIIFQGYASVKSGNFSSQFVVPKSINYESEAGKISVYIFDHGGELDGNGANTNIVIGGSAETSDVDNTSPQISLYINDTISHNQIIGSNILLFAKIADESGVNMSNYGVGGGIVAILDDSISYDLSEYYNANIDSYQKGWVLFPIDDLETGQHNIKVTTSDAHNNVASEIIEFYVNASELVITKLYNFPNPVEELTTFGFSHNFSGDHLEIEFTIYKPDGGVIWRKLSDIVNINKAVEFAELDVKNELKLNKGIYIYGISVRSLSKGVKNQKFQKLIIAN